MKAKVKRTRERTGAILLLSGRYSNAVFEEKVEEGGGNIVAEPFLVALVELEELVELEPLVKLKVCKAAATASSAFAARRFSHVSGSIKNVKPPYKMVHENSRTRPATVP